MPLRPFFLGVTMLLAPLSATLAAAPPSDELTTKESPATFTSRVNLVAVPVVVRDGRGRAVGGLTKDDFRLLDNGKPQFVSRFTIERPGSQPAVKSEKDDALPQPAAAAGTPAAAPPNVASHFVAYLFDDIRLGFGEVAYASEAAIRHLDKSLQPTQRVAVYTTSGKVMLEFTSDRDEIQNAILRIRPSPLTGGGVAKCPDISYFMADLIVNKDDPTALNVALANYVACSGNQYATAREVESYARTALIESAHEVQVTNQVVKEVVRRLSGMPGQRTLILTSPGFFSEMHEHAEVTAVVTKAIAGKVIINSLDARGVWVPPGYDASRPTSAGGFQVITAMNRYMQMEASQQGEVLGELAEGTGGTWIHDNNDLTGSFSRLASPPEFVYMLAYSPDNLKSDGHYHSLKVTLRVPKGLSLQARKGYFAPNREVTAELQAKQDIEDAIFSRDVFSDIPLRLQTQFFKPSESEAKLTVVSIVDVKALHFRQEEGRNRNDVTLVCALFDPDGNYVTGLQKVIELRLRDETLEKRLGSGMTIRTSFDVKPGSYVARVVIRDSVGAAVAAANGAVTIP